MTAQGPVVRSTHPSAPLAATAEQLAPDPPGAALAGLAAPVATIQLSSRAVRTLRAPDAEWAGVVGAVAAAGNRVLATSWRQRRTNEATNDGPGLLHILDAATLADAAAPVPVGVQPRSIAWHPSRDKAYVVNYGVASASCTVVDLASGTATDIPLGPTPVSVAVDPEADRAYVALGLQHAIAVIDTATDQVLSKVKVPANPNFLTLEDGAGTVFSLAQPMANSPTSGTIIVMERSLAVRTMTLPAGRRSNFDIAVAPRGPVYVGNLDWTGGLTPGVLVVDRNSGAQLAMASPGNVRSLALDPAVPSLWAASDGATRLYDVTEVGAVVQATPLKTGPVPGTVAVGPDGIGYVGDGREGTLTAVKSTVVPPPPPPGFAVAMHSGRMNIFVQRPNGRLETTRWAEVDGWTPGFADLGLGIPQTAPVAALSRRPDEWDLFVVDESGRLMANTGNGINPGTWTVVDHGLSPGGSVTAISWDSGGTLLFSVGADGVVRSYGWNGSTASSPTRHEGQQFAPGAPIAAVTRKRAHWDLFVLHPDGTVWTQWWSSDEDSISPWARGPRGGAFAPGTRLTAIGRHNKALDLFAVDRLGQVRTAFWHSEDGWSSWGLIAQGGPHFLPGGTVAAYPKKGDNIDVIAVADDLQLWTAWWDDSWNGWRPLGAAVDRVDAPVTLTGRAFEELDAVWLGPADDVQHTWWNRWQGDWAHILAPVRSVVQDSRFFFEDVRSGDLLRGNVKVTLWPDGVYYRRGRMRNNAVVGVEFEVYSAVLADARSTATNSHVALTSTKRGDADGWEPFGDEDRVFDWAEVGVSQAVQMYYSRTRRLHTGANHENVGIGGAIGDLVDGVIGGFLNAMIDNPVTETVIMGLAVGRELEELVGIDLGGVGGLVGLVAIAPGALWLVAGGVIIPMALGELPFGVRHRTMEQHEWDWAARVFGSTLPPREQIEITNLRGPNDKAFVSVRTPIFPGSETTYYVHIGDQAYESPTTDTDTDRPEPGRLFMHELTHVWDAYHSGPDWMLNAICENRNPALPAATTPWVLLGTEEKAAIVETWFASFENQLDSPDAFADAYFHYIDENIRKSTNSN